MTFTFSKVTPLFLLLGSALVLEACSESDSGPSNAAGASGRAGSTGNEAGAPSSAGAGNDAGSTGEAGSAGTEIGVGGAAGSGGDAGDAGSAGAGGTGAGSGGSSGNPASGGSGGAPSGRLMIPCDINAIYASVCQNCHSEPPLNDAPFALVTLADLQTMALAQYSAVSAGSMPKAGSLTATEKDLLLDWLIDGAPGVPEASCP